MASSAMATEEGENGANKILNVSDLIGSWGPLQRKILTLLSFIYIISAFDVFTLTYYALKDDIWCNTINGTKIMFTSDKCSFNELDSCSSWGYQSDRITISREWNLICERYWLRSLTLSAFSIGYLISGIVIGYISDRFGRKFALTCSVLTVIISQIGIVFSRNHYVFIVLRIVNGIGAYGRYVAALILCMENVGPNVRGKMVICFEWLWYIGTYVMIITCYFVLNFRTIFLGISIYQIITLIAIYFLPESPRWQLVSGDKQKAAIILRQYSTLDDVTFDLKFNSLCEALNKSQSASVQGTYRYQFFSLFKYKQTRNIFIYFAIIWLCRSFIEDGIYYISFDLSSSVFINNSIFTGFTATSNLFMTYSIGKFKRKMMLIVGLVATSVVLLVSLPFTNTTGLFPMVLFIALANCFISTTYTLANTYTPEVFPTQIRNVTVGICASIGKIATIGGTFINQVTASYNLKVTIIVLAIPGIIAAAFTSLLPETKGQEMPDTIEEMVHINSGKRKQLKR